MGDEEGGLSDGDVRVKEPIKREGKTEQGGREETQPEVHSDDSKEGGGKMRGQK